MVESEKNQPESDDTTFFIHSGVDKQAIQTSIDQQTDSESKENFKIRVPVEKSQAQKASKKDQDDDSYDPNDDEDEKLLAAPLAKLKDIKRKQQSILSQSGGKSFDDIDKKKAEEKPA